MIPNMHQSKVQIKSYGLRKLDLPFYFIKVGALVYRSSRALNCVSQTSLESLRYQISVCALVREKKSFVLKSYRCKNPSVCTCFEVALSLVFFCSFLEFGCLRPLKIRLFARAFQRYKNHITSKLFDQDLIEVNSRRNFSTFS